MALFHKNNNEYFEFLPSLPPQCLLTDDAEIQNYCGDTSPSLRKKQPQEQCTPRMFATHLELKCEDIFLQ